MKVIHVVFVLLLVIAGIIFTVVTGDVPDGATGIRHPDIAGLSTGGDGKLNDEVLGAAPYYFQICVILLAGSLLYMGVSEHRRDKLLKASFFVGLAFALFVWGMIWGGYQSYLATGETTILLGFPAPTNWLFWGLWGSFVAFNLFYVFTFYRYFLHPEDEAAFEALAEEMKAEQEAE